MSGQVSGFGGSTNWQPWVDQMVDQVYRVNQNRMRSDQRDINRRITALGEFETKLETLNGVAKDFQSSELFYSRKANLADSDSMVLSATAAPKADLGTYAVNVSQLATVSKQTGALDVGNALHTADITDVSAETGPLLSSMNLLGELKEGFFTVNGVQVTVASTDTLQDVFAAIKSATSDDVLGQYSFSTDKITLTSQSSADMVLGSAADTSNFLSLMRLYSGGVSQPSVESTHKLGVVNINTTIANSALNTIGSVSDTGSFKINGVTISFDKNTDSIRTIMERVEQSSAGVKMFYDKLDDRFHIDNKETGNLGFIVEDTTGGLLSALGLVGGSSTMTLGANAAFSINGGASITSTSNTFDTAVHGIDGLSIKARSTGTETVEVLADDQNVRKCIDAFVSAYNDIESFITETTKIERDANGKMKKGVLASNREVRAIGSQLRNTIFQASNDGSTVVRRLMDLGLDFDAFSRKLEIKSETTLSAQVADYPNDVAVYFTGSTTGLGISVQTLLDQYLKDSGLIDTQKDQLESRVRTLETSIGREERSIKAQRAQLEKSFMKMDSLQSTLQVQQQALAKMFSD